MKESEGFSTFAELHSRRGALGRRVPPCHRSAGTGARAGPAGWAFAGRKLSAVRRNPCHHCMNHRFSPKRRILLVEDNQDNADLVLDLLDEEFVVEWYADPALALGRLQHAADSLPDLLLLDISLPGMDGITLLRKSAGAARWPPPCRPSR